MAFDVEKEFSVLFISWGPFDVTQIQLFSFHQRHHNLLTKQFGKDGQIFDEAFKLLDEITHTVLPSDFFHGFRGDPVCNED